MKKIAALTIVLFMLSVTSLLSFEPEDWSGYSAVKTADALIHTGPGWFYGIVVATDGTNAVTFAVHDSLTAANDKIHPDIICQTSSTNRTCVYGFNPPIPFDTGLYVNITSTDASPDYIVYYRGK